MAKTKTNMSLLILVVVLTGTCHAARARTEDAWPYAGNIATIGLGQQQHVAHRRLLQKSSYSTKHTGSHGSSASTITEENKSRFNRVPGRSSSTTLATPTISAPNMAVASGQPAARHPVTANQPAIMQQPVEAKQPALVPAGQHHVTGRLPISARQPGQTAQQPSRPLQPQQQQAQQQQQQAGRHPKTQPQPVARRPVTVQQPLPGQQLPPGQQALLTQQPVAGQPALVQQPALVPDADGVQQPVYPQHPVYAQQPIYAQPVFAQQPVYAQQPVFAQQPSTVQSGGAMTGVAAPAAPQIVYVPVPVPADEALAGRPARSPPLTKQDREMSNLDFGLIPRLNLSSGLESLESGLSGLVEEFKSNGGFWSGKTRGENVANMVQLGVKAGLNMAAPILNGIASSVPIMVPSLNGQCLNGKPVRPLKSNKRLVMCLVGTGAQVTDYLTNAADLLAGMAGKVLDNPAAVIAGGNGTAVADTGRTDAAAGGEAPAGAASGSGHTALPVTTAPAVAAGAAPAPAPAPAAPLVSPAQASAAPAPGAAPAAPAV